MEIPTIWDTGIPISLDFRADYQSYKVEIIKEQLTGIMITTTIYCAICDQMLRDFSKKKIYYHQQYHEKNYFKCEICDFAFNTSDLFEFHKKRRHGPTTWITINFISAKLL